MANNFNPYNLNPYYNPYFQSEQPVPQQQQYYPIQPQQLDISRPTIPTSRPASKPASQESSQGSAKSQSGAKTRERWQFEDEKVLIALWADNLEKLESKDSRKVWEMISKMLNEKRGINKNVDQCQRKVKHLKNQYKERKDWNRRQSGGHIRKSPHYDEIDAVLGCRDVITCKNVEQMGTSTQSETTQRQETSLEEDSLSTPSPSPSPSTGSTSSGSASSMSTKRRERKRNRQTRKRGDGSESEEESFKGAMKKINTEGEQMTRIVDNMQQSQAQQLQLMTQLLGSFNRYMDSKTAKKD